MEAGPVLLEPIASLKVTVPDSYTGDVMGDLNKTTRQSARHDTRLQAASRSLKRMFRPPICMATAQISAP